MAIKIIPDNQRLAELAGKPAQLVIQINIACHNMLAADKNWHIIWERLSEAAGILIGKPARRLAQRLTGIKGG